MHKSLPVSIIMWNVLNLFISYAILDYAMLYYAILYYIYLLYLAQAT